MFNITVSSKLADKLESQQFNMVKDNVDRGLFLTSMDFKYKNSFYFNRNDKLIEFENLIKDNINDVDFLYALSWYTGKVLGLRLAPVVIITQLINAGKIDKDMLECVVNDVFTRPDFIANSLSYNKKINNAKSIAKIPQVYKDILRNKLSNFNEITLKKRRMERREVKLSDLIKVLKPRPRNQQMSKLYKDIIEKNRGASLVVEKSADGRVTKADSITAVLSDNTITDSEKSYYIEDNLRNLPINALLTNLTNIELNDNNCKVIASRIDSIFKDANAVRFLNPFDLIMLRSYDWTNVFKETRYRYHREGWNLVETSDSFVSSVNKILMKNIVNTININAKCPLILFDISGSMYGESVKMGIKILSFLLPIIGRFTDNIVYYDFGDNLHNKTNIMKNLLNKEPLDVAKVLCKHYYDLPEGTRLLDCTRKAVLRHNDEIDSVMIITDEMTWADTRSSLTRFRSVIPSKLHDRSILFNVNRAQSGSNTAIEPSAQISRIAGLDAKMLYLIEAMFDFDNFKAKMIKSFKKTAG